ncbi:MAG: ABC transporter ATP-binding protein, partial [Synergistaceae bacterium]|nr:ABC transporter ATP-binding protein [Synergistaceae bacterium]
FSLTMLFITHDLSLVEYLCDRVAVMYAGTIVETAPADELCRSPMHPYTQALLSAIPRIDPRRKTARLIMKEEGDSAGEAAEGCVFAGRCPRVRKECFAESPSLRRFGDASEHLVACHCVL